MYQFSEKVCLHSGTVKWTPKIFENSKDPNSVLTDKELKALHPYYQIRFHRIWSEQRNCRPQLYVYSQAALDQLSETDIPIDAVDIFK